MCNRKKMTAEEKEIETRFNLRVPSGLIPKMEEDFGFDHNYGPIIKIDSPDEISMYRWGLIPPTWNKEHKAIWNGTLNAKLEEVDTKYAFTSVTQNRCLIPANAYYEYHWNDAKGKSKTKYIIHHNDSNLFCFAGFFSEWVSPTGEIFRTYTIATTEGNKTMKFVHNKDAQVDYFRMPVMLNPDDERTWFDLSIDHQEFNYPNYKPRLVAFPHDGQLLML